MKKKNRSRNLKNVSIVLGCSLATAGLTLLNACNGSDSASTPEVTPYVAGPPVPALPTSGTFARMVSVNGNYDPSHSKAILVKPGDVVSITADIVNSADGTLTSQGASVEDFVWSANDRDGDTCESNSGDSTDAQDCLSQSSFELNDYGVNFYVPYNIGAGVKISVADRDNPSLTDTILLRNSLYSTPALEVTPTVVVTSAAAYPYPVFDSSYALAGQGNWVYVSGRRFWVPTLPSADWVPYQNGYWTFVENDGWTWVSNDNWGWYTDHYGVWRHHGVYGWVWEEFPDRVYRPATVSWIYDDNHVGWYPYYDNYRDGYRFAVAEGFDDGYWLGARMGDTFQGQGFRPGFTVVNYTDFRSERLVDVRITDEVSVETIYTTNYSAGRVRPFPGGTDIVTSREYINARVGGEVAVTRVDTHSCGGAVIRQPIYVHPVAFVPAQPIRRDVPVGSIAERGGDGRVTYIPPTNNGHGIVMPPRIHGDIPPPMTNHPSQPNPNNGGHVMPPSTGSRPVPRPRPQPPVVTPQPPVHHEPPVMTPQPPVHHEPPVTPPPVFHPPMAPPVSHPAPPAPVHPVTPPRPEPTRPQPPHSGGHEGEGGHEGGHR